MPEVTVEPPTYERLKQHAVPFETPEGVILRALDALDALKAWPEPTDPGGPSIPKPEEEILFDPFALPDLTYTTVRDASINGEPIRRPKWNPLLEAMLIRIIKGHNANFQKLTRLCPANIVKGRKADDGFTHLPEIDISVQGQSAHKTCEAIVATAQGLGISFDIGFKWRLNERAAYPGQWGRIRS